MKDIISKSNDRIKDLIKIRDDKKFRKDKSLFYVEGERIISNISPKIIDSLYILKDKINYFKDIVNSFDEEKIYLLSNEVFDKVKDTVNSQGIIALVKINDCSNINLNIINNILILDDIKDPGNLGTIIRTAEASGIDLIVLSKECCDIYNTKTVRASMSSITRVNIIYIDDIILFINKIKNYGFQILSSYLDINSMNLYNVKFKNKKNAVVIGNEANGIRKEIIDISNTFIKIPMNGKIESLNASSAATIIMYEIYRQNYEN